MKHTLTQLSLSLSLTFQFASWQAAVVDPIITAIGRQASETLPRPRPPALLSAAVSFNQPVPLSVIPAIFFITRARVRVGALQALSNGGRMELERSARSPLLPSVGFSFLG